MSTTLYPPVPRGANLESLLELNRLNELRSHLAYLLTTISSLTTGLSECLDLLKPFSPGNTLVLSSSKARLESKNESIKGYVTRLGAEIIRADLRVNMPALRGGGGRFTLISSSRETDDDPPDKDNGDHGGILLRQMVELQRAVDRALSLVDVPSWTGDRQDAHYVRGQVRMLGECLEEGQAIINGQAGRDPWPHNPGLDHRSFVPPLPPNLHADVFLFNACITIELRTLDPVDSIATSISTLTSKFSTALGGALKSPLHDEVGRVFTLPEQISPPGSSPRSAGKREVRVREKIIVESADPHLLAVRSKLDALKRSVDFLRWGLEVLMGYADQE